MFDVIRIAVYSLESFSPLIRLSSCSKATRQFVVDFLMAKLDTTESALFTHIAKLLDIHKKSLPLLEIEEDSLYADEEDPREGGTESASALNEAALQLAVKTSITLSRLFPAYKEDRARFADTLANFHMNLGGWILILKEEICQNRDASSAKQLLDDRFERKDIPLLTKEKVIENLFALCLTDSTQSKTESTRIEVAFALSKGPFRQMISSMDLESLFHRALRLGKKEISEEIVPLIQNEDTQRRLASELQTTSPQEKAKAFMKLEPLDIDIDIDALLDLT